MNQKLLSLLPCLLSLVLIATPAVSHAQTVPSGMTYQGRLTDSNGVASPDGTGYEIEVRLWTTSTGGTTPIWAARYAGVHVKNGGFNIILGAPGGVGIGGAIADLKAVFATAPTTYLALTVTKNAAGVAVAGATEILPRQQLFSSPYAFRAEVAASVDPNAIVSASIKEGAVTNVDLGVGSVTNDKLSAEAVRAENIQAHSIGAGQLIAGGITMDRLAVEYAEYVDERPAGTGGGSGTLNQFNRRVLNKTVAQHGTSVSRSGDFITVQPGTYWVHAYARTNGTNQVSLLRDTTDNALIVGSTEFVQQDEETHSNITGILNSTSAPITFSLVTYLTTGSSNRGSLGSATNFPGMPNIFSKVVIIKMK